MAAEDQPHQELPAGGEEPMGWHIYGASDLGLVGANASVTKPHSNLCMGESDGTKSEFAAAITNKIVCK